MSRWENEDIVYRRFQDWKSLSNGDEFINTKSNLGITLVKLNYENKTIRFQKIVDADGRYEDIAYFPIEELEQIVGHMKHTMKRRQKEFEENAK